MLMAAGALLQQHWATSPAKLVLIVVACVRAIGRSAGGLTRAGGLRLCRAPFVFESLRKAVNVRWPVP
jgi:hypothetical protein